MNHFVAITKMVSLLTLTACASLESNAPKSIRVPLVTIPLVHGKARLGP